MPSAPTPPRTAPRDAAAASAPLQLELFGPNAGETLPGPGAARTAAPGPSPFAAGPGAQPIAPQAAAPPPAAVDSGPQGAAAPGPQPASRRGLREIALGEHRVAYELRRARRRSIGFLVGPEGLTVSAPRWVGQGEIEAALREKGRWILRKLHEQRERQRRLQAARIEWRDGATLPFLGETVIVVLDPRVTGSQLRAAEQTLPGVPRLTLHLGLPHDAGPGQIRDAVQGWLQRQARRGFEERSAIYPERLRVRVARLALSAAATRWGSASADGSIRLNWRLVHFALPVIDYVVTHELAHLREMNHGPAFWDVVRGALPDYEAARGVLRREIPPVFE